MTTDLIHDRGRGPEIQGTRITIYDLIPHFLDSDVTEASICQRYDLTSEQVAAARAYVLNQPDVLGRFLRIEAKMAAGNPPEVIERAEQTRAALLSFKEWLAQRRRDETQGQSTEGQEECNGSASRQLPTFKEWLAETELRSGSAL